MALASAAGAGEYRSGFGFAITVPDVWLVLTRDEVARHADLFLEDEDEDEGDGELRAIPLAMRRAVFERIEAGELEIFYRREQTPGPFIDNVNVMDQPASLPRTEAELAQLCELLPVEFSRVFGRPIAMDVCELRERIGRPALYLQFDGAVEGTTTLQYQLLRRSGSSLVFTATATRDHLPRLMSEFEEMVGSVRLP
jgi:hypothetical protein